MDSRAKQRLTGAVILVALFVLLVPELLTGPRVADAPEGVRGDSANNVQKAITLETGITVQAPLFIKTGEKIKVDTRTGKYMERA